MVENKSKYTTAFGIPVGEDQNGHPLRGNLWSSPGIYFHDPFRQSVQLSTAA